MIKEAAPTKKNFDFVDTIRCISMIGIVFEHSSILWGIRYKELAHTAIEIGVMQIFKFVTIAFFIIGGFLINHKFTEYTPGQYLKNRIASTIAPWCFWIIVLIALDAIQIAVVHFRYAGDRTPISFWTFISEELYHTVFFTSFWFVLNFLICISILLIFKKYLYNIWFGIFWGIVSLFYSLNIYHSWLPTAHNLALFGFIFYLWLGVYMNKHYVQISTYIKKITYFRLIVLNIVLLLLATGEGLYMSQLKLEDWYNTLRITNILYSLGMFILLLKIGRIKWLNKSLQPRQTTFGIYLLHTLVIVHISPELLRHFHFKIENFTLPEAISYSILRFTLVYLITFLLVRLIMTTRFKWSLGIKNVEAKSEIQMQFDIKSQSTL